MLSVAIARSSSGGILIRYVLPVLWMTSCLHKRIDDAKMAYAILVIYEGAAYS